jgi:hypothetical protein
VAAVSLIHGTFGGGVGVLEAVARVGNQLVHLWRDLTPAAAWHTTEFFAKGVDGNPVLIESASRNFEVVVPAASTGLIHYYRNNNLPTKPWSGPRPFATGLGHVDAVTLIQSNFGGNLEVVARVEDRLYQMWRTAGPPGTWSTPKRIF